MVPRPCPHTACRHNLRGGHDMMNTNCSLDFAEWGGMTQREVAKALQLRLKDVVEAEKTGMEKLRNGLRENQERD